MILVHPQWYSYPGEPTLEQLIRYCEKHEVEVALEADLKQLWAGYDYAKRVV